MKKLLISIITVLMLFCLAFGLTACNGENNDNKEPTSYKISFMVESEVYHTVETLGEEVISMPSNPTKNGYNFEGWYLDTGLNSPFTAYTFSTIKLSNDILVYSKFIEQTTPPSNNDNNENNGNNNQNGGNNNGVNDETPSNPNTNPGTNTGGNTTENPPTPPVIQELVSTPGLAFTLSEDETYYICTGIGTATSGNIVVGDKYNNLPVKEIADDAFYGRSNLLSITIGNNVTSIGQNAFYECLAQILWGDSPSVSIIKEYDFNGYQGTNLTIPNSVTSIGGGAFSGCISLESIVILNSVTSIGVSAFHGCSSLKSIEIPSSVTSISLRREQTSTSNKLC